MSVYDNLPKSVRDWMKNNDHNVFHPYWVSLAREGEKK